MLPRFEPLRLAVPLSILLAAAACSSGGGPTGPSSSGTSSLSGQVVDQFSGVGIAGIAVQYAGASAITDGEGRFTITGGSGAAGSIVVAGQAIHARETFASTSNVRLDVVRADFDMSAFHDVGREHSDRTIRWLNSPSIYVDTRVTGGSISPVDLEQWIAEIEALAPSFVAEWSGGVLAARTVVVGQSPPASGAIVLRFDEDPAGYPNPRVAGMTSVSWTTDGVIASSGIRLRFSGLSGPAAKYARQGILAHELGHALGLSHMDGPTSSIMASVVRTPVLTEFDRSAGRILYGRPPGNRNLDRDTRAMTAGALAPASAWVTSESGGSLPALDS
jgi:hypothetical protein